MSGGGGAAAIQNFMRVANVIPRRPLPRRVAKESSRMIRHDQWDTVIPVYLSAQLSDRERRLQQRLCRERAESNDHARADQLDLPNEIRLTRRDLLWARVPVRRRSMLEHIADKDVFARQADGGQDLVQELSRLTNEGTTRCILVRPRRFAYTHQLGRRRTLPGDVVGRRERQGALRAG